MKKKGYKDKRQKKTLGEYYHQALEAAARYGIDKTIPWSTEDGGKEEILIHALRPDRRDDVISRWFRGKALSEEEERLIIALSFTRADIQRGAGFGSPNTADKHVKHMHEAGWILSKDEKKYIFNQSGDLFKFFYQDGEYEKVQEFEKRIQELATMLIKTENTAHKTQICYALKKCLDGVFPEQS